MVDISIVNGIITNLELGGHHLAETSSLGQTWPVAVSLGEFPHLRTRFIMASSGANITVAGGRDLSPGKATIWESCNDLSARSLGIMANFRGIIPEMMAEVFRLVNYCNLPRIMAGNSSYSEDILANALEHEFYDQKHLGMS